MPHFTIVPNPCSPGSTVTICVSPAPINPVYANVSFFDKNGVAFVGVGLRFTSDHPCWTVKVPDGADHGLVVDQAGQIQDGLIQIT